MVTTTAKKPWAGFEENDDTEALLASYYPLAEYLARKFIGRGEALEDLMQVASIGLLKAIQRFDADRGVEFPTYATPTILGELKRHFRDSVSWPVRVPRRLQEVRLRVRLGVAELHQELGRSPTIEEIGRHVGLDEDSILEGMEAEYASRSVSLDGVRTDDADNSSGPMLAWEPPEFALTEEWAFLCPYVSSLPEREQKILILRFFHDLTQNEIADHLGISQMHVSRLLGRSLRALRRAIDEAERAEAAEV